MSAQSLTSPPTVTTNRIIASLPEAEQRELLAHAEPVQLKYQRTLYEAGDSVKHTYFPASCVITEVAIMNDGTTVETGMIGCEGAVGITSAFGEYGARSWTRVLIPGEAQMMAGDVLRRMFRESEVLRRLLLEYYRTRISHVSRRAVCNTRHHLNERVGTWLLMLHDRAPADDIPLTQEAVARQLGARRAGVNEVMVMLQRHGAIEHWRGHIRVSDRAKLESMACVCYRGHGEDFEWWEEGRAAHDGGRGSK